MAVKHSMSKDSIKDSIPMESVFIQFSGAFMADQLIEQGLKILAKTYQIGTFEVSQSEPGWVSGMLEIDSKFCELLDRLGEYHKTVDGVSINCEMP